MIARLARILFFRKPCRKPSHIAFLIASCECGRKMPHRDSALLNDSSTAKFTRRTRQFMPLRFTLEHQKR